MIRIFLLLLTILPLAAQERPRTVRTLFLNGPRGDHGPYYLFDGKTSQEIELSSLNLSPVYEVRSGKLKLWLTRSRVEDPEKLPEGSPEVVVGEGITDFYLVFSNDGSDGELPLRMQVVDAGFDRIGRGESLWFNLTAKPVAGMVGERKLRLAPRTTALVREPVSGRGDYLVDLYFQIPGDDTAHPLIEGRWRHDPRIRSIIFVFDEGKRRAPRISSFSDFRLSRDSE